MGLVITIDGPSGTGKSTAAKGLAKRLGYLYLDTGAMYRAVALKALRKGVRLTDRRALVKLARESRVSLRMNPDHQLKVFLDGKDATQAIRRPEVAEVASQIAVIPQVRRILVRWQQILGSKGKVVAEGRDTGTVVFPRADLKVFLTASLTQRARRRFRQLRQKGFSVTFDEVLGDTQRRDLRDSKRLASPLRVAQGAIRIDNTWLKSFQVVGKILDYVRRVQKRG